MAGEEYIAQIRAALAEGVRCIVVTGAAGTGKTTLIREMIPVLSSLRYDVKLLAPTGRAAKMIEARTEHAASTIHSAIFRIEDKPVAGTAEDGNLRWVFPLKRNHPARTAFVVDESSMVGAALHNDGILQFGTGSLLRDLLDYSGVGRSISDNVIVFVGDPFQLPSVGEKISNPPALDAAFLEDLIGSNVATVRLETVHRQREGSGILEVARKLRSAIHYHLFNTFRSCEYQDVHNIDETQFEALYHPESGINDKIVISCTNARVWEFNRRIRRLLGRGDAMPGCGERLLSLRNTLVTDGEGRERAFMNGDMLQVIEVLPDTPINLTGFYRPKEATETLRFDFTFMRVRAAWLYERDYDDADVWLNVTPVLSESFRANREYALLALYVAVSNRIRERFKLGYSEEDEQILRERLKKSRLYHAPIVTFGYAITGHKAQGGEWKEVWIDYHNPQNKMTEAYFRWMYTAITRARNMVFALSAPVFDDIADALVRGLARIPAESADDSRSPSELATPLTNMLAQHGYVISETIRNPFLVRVMLAKSGDPFSESGRLDLNFNGKDIISYVRLSCPGASDGFGREIAALKGRNIRSVLDEKRGDALVHEPNMEVVESHCHIRDRLCAAAEKGGLHVLSMKSITPNQLRINLSSEIGDGYVDFYINATGRVTEMGSMTVPRAGLERLREGLG